jgi:DNA-binding PucR family transcriptional regulator
MRPKRTKSSLEEAGGSQTGSAAALALTARSLEYVDVISTAATEAYLRVQQRLVAEADRAKRDLLDDMLAGRFGLREETRASAAALGLEPTGEYVVVAGAVRNKHSEQSSEALRHAASAIAHHAALDSRSPFVVVRHQEVVGVIRVGGEVAIGIRERIGRATEMLKHAHGIALRAGISTTCGLADIPRGYQEAYRALHLSNPSNPVVALGEVSLFEYLVAHAEPTVRRIVPLKARRLLEEDARQDGVLIDTLLAYLDADLNIGRTAERLIVHPNTVHYRLRKINQITGRSPHRFWDLLELLAAVSVLRSLETEPSSQDQ